MENIITPTKAIHICPFMRCPIYLCLFFLIILHFKLFPTTAPILLVQTWKQYNYFDWDWCLLWLLVFSWRDVNLSKAKFIQGDVTKMWIEILFKSLTSHGIQWNLLELMMHELWKESMRTMTRRESVKLRLSDAFFKSKYELLV
jgi:hypothetical protein